MTNYPVRRSNLDPLVTSDFFTGSALDVFDDLFNSVMGNRKRAKDLFRTKIEYPKTDVYLADNKLTFEMAVPGLTKDDIDVSIEDDVLTVKSRKTEKKEESNEETKYFFRELKHSSFSRSWSLPSSEVDLENQEVTSTLSNGILQIEIPVKAAKKPRSIPIKIDPGGG